MADSTVFTSDAGGSNRSVLRHNQRPISSSSSTQPVDSFFLPESSNSTLGSTSMVNFEHVRGGKRPNTLFFCPVDQGEYGDEEDYEDYPNQPGKKRRLTRDQVRLLEQSFEVENKLEPERKVQLAKDLNLQPKQVAIWFQNRRARWKSKQLEKDYDVLQSQFDCLKANYDNLLKEKETLKDEVELLSDKLNHAEKEAVTPNLYDANEASQIRPKDHPIVESTSGISQSKASSIADVFEVENLRYADIAAHSTTYIFDHDYHSDISQDDEDNMSRSLFPPLNIFPKLEDDNGLSDLPANSCNLGGLPAEDQAIWSWCL